MGNNRARKELVDEQGRAFTRRLSTAVYRRPADTACRSASRWFYKDIQFFLESSPGGREGSLRAWMERVMANTAWAVSSEECVNHRAYAFGIEVPEDYEEPDASAVEMIPVTWY